MIGPKSQQYTPRWIVKFLVQNTLGRLWLAMHPDSRLREELDYLVPLAQEAAAEPLRPVREITLLDPACGTMHFGLVAFDLFVTMYREEIEHAGEPGWPEVPSVADVAESPAAIVQHNLFGMDIDLRAVQLSALTLLLKARGINPKTRLTDHNLACADVQLLNGVRLAAFLEEAKLGPIYERLIQGLWGRLKDSNQLGSLLRLETNLQDLITSEQRRFEAARQRPHLPGFALDQFETEAGRQEFWSVIEAQIGQAFEAFAHHRSEQGYDERYFTGEAVKGLHLLDLMQRRYDVVVTNPPYIDSRDYNDELKVAMERLYPEGKRNLYAAFVIRCLELLTPSGQLGMITPQTFMFISSFEALREHIKDGVVIEALVQTGLNTFADAVVDCAFYVLRREPNAIRRLESTGTYVRLVKEPDAEAKRRGFEQALVRLKAGQPDPTVYRYRQGDFEAIPGAPWVYWITPGLREIFSTMPKLGAIAQPRVGLQTGDNARFLRYWWETNANHIGFDCREATAAQASGEQWFPYISSFR